MANDDAHYYRTADGTGLPHDPFNAIVGPRPIGWRLMGVQFAAAVADTHQM